MPKITLSKCCAVPALPDGDEEHGQLYFVCTDCWRQCGIVEAEAVYVNDPTGAGISISKIREPINRCQLPGNVSHN